MDNNVESEAPPPVSSLRSRFEALAKGGASAANGDSKQPNVPGRIQTNPNARPMTPTVVLTPSTSSNGPAMNLRRVVSNPTSQPVSPAFADHPRSSSEGSMEDEDMSRDTMKASPNDNLPSLSSSALRANKTLPTGIGFPPKQTSSTISRSLSGSNINKDSAQPADGTSQQAVTDVENMSRKLLRKPPPPPPAKKQPPPPPSRAQPAPSSSLSSSTSRDSTKSPSATDLDLPVSKSNRASPSLPPRPSTATDRSSASSISLTSSDATSKSPSLPPRLRDAGSPDTTVLQHSMSGFKTPSNERLAGQSSPPPLPSRSQVSNSSTNTATGPPLPPRSANPSTDSRLSAPPLPPRSAFVRNESSSEDVSHPTVARRRVPPPPSSDSRPVSQHSVSPSGSFESLTPSQETPASATVAPSRTVSTEGGAFLPPPSRTAGMSAEMMQSGNSKPREHHFPHLPQQLNALPITKIFAAVKFGNHSSSAHTRNAHDPTSAASEPSPVSAGLETQGTTGLLPPPVRSVGDGATSLRPTSSLKRRSSGSSSSDEDEPPLGDASTYAPAKRVIAKIAEELPDSSRSNRRPPILWDFEHVPNVLAPHHRSAHHHHHIYKHGNNHESGAELHVPYQGVVAVAGWWVVVASPGVVTITNMDPTSDARRRHHDADETDHLGGSGGVWTIDLEELPIEWKSEKPRVTAMEFRHGVDAPNGTTDQGRYLWCGTKDGVLLEFDIWNGGRLIDYRASAHTVNVVGIYRLPGARMLTMDESGKTLVFCGIGSTSGGGREEQKWLSRSNPRVHRTGHKDGFARLLNGRLWTSSAHHSTDTNGQVTSSSSPSGSLNGKNGSWGGSLTSLTSSSHRHLHHSSSRHRHGPMLRIHEVDGDGAIESLSCAIGFDVGTVTCGTTLPSTPGLVYLGHQGGWITIWSDPLGEQSKQEKDVRPPRPAIHRQHSASSFLSTATSTSDTGSLTDEGTDAEATVDGHVPMIDPKAPICLRKIKVAATTLTALEGVGSKLWAGLGSGTIYVYEITEDPRSQPPQHSPSQSESVDDENSRVKPWIVTNIWKAYIDRPIVKLCLDPFSISQTKKLVVYSVAREGAVRFWDGFLAQDWIDAMMVQRESSFCVFRPLRLLVCSWNIDAAKPDALTGTNNVTFLHKFLTSSHGGGEIPDIIVFGFQEVIDLEDKKLTAKTVLLGPSKKKLDGSVSAKVSRHYKLWHDKLVAEVQRAFPSDSFVVQHTDNLVGLFTCIFVRRSVVHPTQSTTAVADVAITTIKCGMKGMYGNKGAIVARFTIDDTSLCFLNCHLAAGQKQKLARNLDLASILEEKSVFPSSTDPRSADTGEYLSYVGGGDGSMILDHELCFLNGDLNYRIDLRRDAVINHVQAGHLEHLLQYDQLLHELKVNPAFRLHTFSEAPITFAPTYKYDRHSTTYDTSEKRRIPAWCDRILYRTRDPSRIQNLWYGRYEPDVSDHRPVCGVFTIMTKKVVPSQRDVELRAVEQLWREEESKLIAAALAYVNGR